MDKKDNIYRNLENLITDHLSGNISEEDKVLLSREIHRSEANKQQFIKSSLAWAATVQYPDNNFFNSSKALITIHHRMDQMDTNTKSKVIPLWSQFMRIAAIFIVIFLLGSGGMYLVMNNRQVTPEMDAFISVSAPKGSKAMTILPDGTKVWLNAGSNLSYNIRTYGIKNRKVALLGEGYFKVISNAKKPFIVEAKELLIKAFGTEFDVKAYPEENTVETTLVKGIVKIEGKDEHKKSFIVNMVPKQKVTFFAGKALVDNAVLNDPATADMQQLSRIKIEALPANVIAQAPTINNIEKPALYTSWKDDSWMFEGEEIGNLAVLLERRYNVSIVFNANELRNYKFTGTFQHETLEQVMQVLQMTAPLRYTIGKGKVVLMLDTDLKVKYKKYMNF